jgi:hypothetical protein
VARGLGATVPLCLLAVISGASAQKPRPVLTGSWRLDSVRTEQPRYVGSTGLQRTDLGTRGMFDAPVRGREAPLDAEALMRALRPVLQLRIQQTDSTVSLSDGTGELATYRTDGRKVREPQLVGGDIEISARWKDQQLTIERKVPELATIRETYYLDPGTMQLIVAVRLSGSKLPRDIEVRRVYDPFNEGTR